MKIVSWNVNGLRSVVGKGFLDWLDKDKPDIVGLQEVRANPDQIAPCLAPLGDRFHQAFSSAERPGYSGVGLLSTRKPDRVITSMKHKEFDAEGRMQIAHFGGLTLVNAYFPNGSGKDRDNSRIPFKLEFYQKLFNLLETRKKRGEPILVLGDFNTAHSEIDLARPKENEKTSGFRPEEREELDRWLRAGYVDTFRCFQKEGGHYSWWSQRFGVRAKNIGWRIDYVLASKGAEKYLKHAFINPQVQGSDHCPIGVEVDDTIIE